ncbi:serine hydrolase [Cytophagaceae bacterium YF14B1]|uniref:Serine hydrolase n=1 Tax=Xanthocytophaga flava TaxID=3048013 RepID=A0AAE3QRU2_9BACT|nr:serine hydrolase [Xanthocytophaga flavus]MDJ1484297.1 serine hydrolase [Xanthocytophaga flavus]
MKKHTMLFILLLCSSTLFGQQENIQKLSSFINEVLKTAPQVPGLSVVVVQDDSIVFAGGFGWADIEKKIKATSETGFYIASTTKSFTALVAALLANQGKIDLKRSISTYAPFNRLKNKQVFENISILDLLTHQSGVSNDILSFKLAYAGDYSQQMINDLIDNYTTYNKEGKEFVYSNLGYYFFSVLLKEEFGLDWRELVRDQIFGPLKMSNTTAYMSVARQHDLAMPYIGILSQIPKPGYLMKEDDTMHAAGGIVSTASDIGCWLKFQLNEGRINGKQLYLSDVVRMTHLEQVKNKHNYSNIFDGKGYALGWRTGKFKSMPLIYHFGGYPGFFSHISFIPEKKIGVAIFVNHDLGNVPGNLIAEYAYDLYLGNSSSVKKHENEATKMLTELIKKKQEEVIEFDERLAQRKWQLTQPRKSYAGTYENTELGKIKVTVEQDQIMVSFGHTGCIATAMELPDAIRVELVPGEGIALKFIIKEQQVEAIKFKGITFSRSN